MKYAALRSFMPQPSAVKYFVLQLMMLVYAGTASAQSSVVIGGLSGSNSNQYGPYITNSTTAYKSRNVYLYTAAELNLPEGAVITGIDWLKANANTVSGDNTFNLWLGNTNLATLGSSAVWGDFINLPGIVQVYGSTTRPMLAVTGGYEMFPAGQTFAYVGGNLLVMTDWAATGPTSGSNNFYYQSAAGMSLGTRVSSSTTMTNSTSLSTTYGNNRPTIRISYSVPPVNAGITSLITPSYNFLCETVTSQEIRVELKNYGSNILNTVRINMQMDGGAPTWVDWTAPVDVYGSVAGNSAVVSLGNIPFSRNTHNLKIWTSNPNGIADTLNADDTLYVTISANSLNGNYTIGGAAPDFTTVQDAAGHLNTYGVCGPVAFLLRDGTYPGQITLESTIPGLSAANPVVFRSETGNANAVQINYAATGTANNWVLKLNGASYISFRELTFSATGTSYQRVIELAGGASHIIFDKCQLTAPATGPLTTNSVLLYAAAGGMGDANRFTGNQLENGYYGISVSGTSASSRSDSVVFEKNTIKNAKYTSVAVSYTDNLKFRNNIITTNSATATQYGLNITYGYNDLEVTGNRLSGMAGGYGMYFSNNTGAATQKGIVANNEISFGSNTTASYGIYSVSTVYQRIYNNSVNLTGTSATGYAGYFSWTSTSYNNNEVLNNVFLNSGGGRSLYFVSSSVSYNNVCDYNNLYSTGTILATGGTSTTPTYANLSLWRSSPLHTDGNSISYDPGFTSATDLRPDGTKAASWSLNGRGIHILDNSVDLSGNARATVRTAGVPDIGAYEFTPSSVPPAAVSSLSGSVESFTFGGDTVAQVDWGGTIPVSLTVRQYSGTLPVNTPADHMYFYTEISAPAGNYGHTATVYYKDPWMGNITDENDARLAQSDGTSWHAYAGTASGIDTVWNRLKVSGLTAFSSYTGSMAKCSGQPPAAAITSAPVPNSLCAGSTVSVLAAADLTTDGLSDIAYQWEDSTVGGTWAAVTGGTGATTLDFTSGPLERPTWLRLRTICLTSGQSATGSIYEVPVTIRGVITQTIPGERCGPGQVELVATGTPGSRLSWFNSAGLFQGNGDTLITSSLSADATYFVSADAGGRSLRAGPAVRTGTTNTNSTYGLIFDAQDVFTLDSIAVYPIGNGTAGTVTVGLYQSGTLLQQAVVDVTGTASPGVKTMVPLNFYVPAGTNYRLQLNARSSSIMSLGYESSNSGFPYAIPGVLNIRGGTSSTSVSSSTTSTAYYYFYDWQISTRCEGPRVAVNAKINALPVVTVTTADPLTFCADTDSALLTAVPSVAGFDYQWTRNNEDTILGATGMSYGARRPGQHRVMVTDTNGCAGVSSNSQDISPSLSGVYTIGGPAPDFATIAQAVSHLNLRGVCGPVTFLLRSGEYNEQAIISGTIPGLGASNPITFRSEAGVADSVLIWRNNTSTTTNYVLRLNGSSYISLRQLTFEARGTTYHHAVELTGACSENTIDSCVLRGPVTTTVNNNGSLLYAASLTGASYNNAFTNNLFQYGSYGVYYYGTSTTSLTGSIVFEGNRIEDVYAYSAAFGNISGLKFRNNTISTGSTSTAHYGIYTTYADENLEISGNRIKGLTSGYGISLNNNRGTSSAPGRIFNNEISFGSNTTASYGIYSVSTVYQRIYNNSVNLTGTSVTGYAGYFSWTSTSYNNNEVLNNVFSNSGGGRSLYFVSSSVSYNNVCDYNNLYSTGTILATGGTSTTPTYANLSLWRSSPLHTDGNSISYDPGFTSAADLRPDGTKAASWSLNGRGIHILDNSVDLSGNARATVRTAGVPDIGAYEFTPSSVPPVAVATPAAPAVSSVQVFTFGEDTVARITWGTFSALPASISVRQYTGTVPVAPPTDYMHFYTDIDVPGGPYDYTADIYYKDPWLGNISVEDDLRMAQQQSGVWKVFTGVPSMRDTLSNILTVTGLTAFSEYTGSLYHCDGQPAVPDLLTAALQFPRCLGDTAILSAEDPAGFGVSGISYQWEDSTAAGTWSPVSGGTGGTTLQYITDALTETTWLRLRSACVNSGLASFSAVYEIPVVAPGQVTSVTPGERCGPGTVELNAVGTAGSVLSWFNAPAGGSRLDTGTRFITPSLSADSVFYVSADAGGRRAGQTGLSDRIGTTNTTTLNYGLIFDAQDVFTLDSIAVYPIGNGTAGTITVSLYQSGTVLQQAVVDVTGSATPGVKTMVPLHFYVPAGTNYRLQLTARSSSITSLGYESSNSGFPYAIPGVLNIRGGTSSTSVSSSTTSAAYYYFYDWRVSTRCEGPRRAVLAKVHALPVVTVTGATPPSPFCAAMDSVLLEATPVVNNFDYQWTKNGMDISGARDTFYYAGQQGDYKVLVTDTNNCTGASAATIQVTPSLNGTYTVGGQLPDFATLPLAVTYLHTHGVCGPVTFLLRSGSYAGQTVISNAVPGLSAANPVTFRSEAGVADSVVLTFSGTSTTNNYVWRLDGASYISLRQLTLQATGSTYCRALDLAGAASGNTVDSCVLTGSVSTTTSSPDRRAVICGSQVTGTDNVFTDNIIRDGSYGIYYTGTSASPAGGAVFERNTIEGSYMISANFTYTDNLKFRDNTISITSAYTSHAGLQCTYGFRELEVTGNRITGMVSGNGMDLQNNDGTASGRGLVSNNVISIGSGTGAIRGISSTNSSYQSIYNNSVHVTGTSSTGYAGYFTYNGAAFINNEIYNNVFANTGNGRGLYMYTAAANNNSCDYNNIYTTGTVLATGGTSSATTFAALSNWRASPLGFDRNSISYRPGFTSATDLRPDPSDSAVWSLNGRGIQIAGNDHDIEGNPRSTTLKDGVPDIGAYEFEPVSIPPFAVATPALPAAGSVQAFTFGGDTVVRITWASGAAVPGGIGVKAYSGRMGPNLTLGDTMYFHTDIETPPGTYNYTADIYYKDPWLGTVTAEADLRMAKQNSGAWWILYGGARSSVDISRNILKTAGLTDFFLYTGSRETPCSGQPLAPGIDNAVMTAALCERDSIMLHATDLNPNSGITYQWEQASRLSGPWNSVTGGTGGTALDYNTGALYDTIYYRLNLTCTHSGLSAQSTAYEVLVMSPGVITDTFPAERCGPGTLTLEALGTPGNVIRWYNTPAGGVLMHTGNSFTTPPLSFTTVYYVAISNGICESLRLPVTAVVNSLPVTTVNTPRRYLCAGDSVILSAATGYVYQWQVDGTDIPGAVQSSYTVYLPGAYRVIISGGGSCVDTSQEIPIVVYPALVPIVLSDGRSLLTDAGYVRYQWNRNGIPVPGATGISYTPDSAGSYTVTVTDTNGCTGISAPHQINVGTGKEVSISSVPVRIYPNPASGIVFIDAPVRIHVRVSSMDGKEVFSSYNVQSIDIGWLADGMYLIRVTDADGVLLKTEKLMKSVR